MNIVDWFYACLIYVWSELDKAAVTAGVISVVVAILRMRKRGKVVWSEALLCGVFATIAIVGMQFIVAVLGIPADGWVSTVTQGGSTVIGAAIGWYGTDRTVGYVENKLGDKNEETNLDRD